MIVDASVWVSSLLTDDIHHAASDAWFQWAISEGTPMAIPSLALAEVAGALSRRGQRAELVRSATLRMEAHPAVRIVSVDFALGKLAADLATRWRLRGADAIYVATASALEMPLLTWDRELHGRVRDTVPVLSP